MQDGKVTVKISSENGHLNRTNVDLWQYNPFMYAHHTLTLNLHELLTTAAEG